MKILLTFFVTFFAGMGAGLGTGFAGMSAAAVISPMLITFLGMEPYMAVGIALSSDVLASAVSAYTYKKNGNLDVKNGLIMMVSVLVFTVVGSWVSSLVPSTTMGTFCLYDIPAGHQIHRAAGYDHEGGHAGRIREEAGDSVRGLWYPYRLYLRLRGRRRRYDDASYPDLGAGLRAEDGGGNQRIYHGLHSIYRSGISFRHRWHAGLDGLDSLRDLYPALGANRGGVCQ